MDFFAHVAGRARPTGRSRDARQSARGRGAGDGGPVLLPWLDRVPAALEAWYPGSQGGAAIARVLSGAGEPIGAPSGFVPARARAVAATRKRPGTGLTNQAFEVSYDEGAAVGYRWYDRQHLEPRLPFGHGLSYTRFAQDG